MLDAQTMMNWAQGQTVAPSGYQIDPQSGTFIGALQDPQGGGYIGQGQSELGYTQGFDYSPGKSLQDVLYAGANPRHMDATLQSIGKAAGLPDDFDWQPYQAAFAQSNPNGSSQFQNWMIPVFQIAQLAAKDNPGIGSVLAGFGEGSEYWTAGQHSADVRQRESRHAGQLEAGIMALVGGAFGGAAGGAAATAAGGGSEAAFGEGLSAELSAGAPAAESVGTTASFSGSFIPSAGGEGIGAAPNSSSIQFSLPEGGFEPVFDSGGANSGVFSEDLFQGADLQGAFGGEAGPGGPGGATFGAEPAGQSYYQQFLDWMKKRGMLKTGMQGLNAVSGIYGMNKARQLEKLAQAASPMRTQAVSDAAALQADPSRVTSLPGYKAGLQAVERRMASQGYLGSGNMMVALRDYGGKQYDTELARLTALAQPSATELQGTIAANQMRNQSLKSLGYAAMGLFS